MKRGEIQVTTPTGLKPLDEKIQGFANGGLSFIGGRPSIGKSLADSQRILTTEGWVPIGKVEIGMKVYGSDGKSHKILGVYPQGLLPIYVVTFDDGTEVECSLDHLWEVYNRPKNKTEISTTRRDYEKSQNR